MLNIQSFNSEVIFTNAIKNQIQELFYSWKGTNIFILTDLNTKELCLPILSEIFEKYDCKILSIEAEDEHKTIYNLQKIWKFLGDHGADRKSLLINLGGGMITDIGGFAASTFKRGINFWNIPTTLLSMVDASVGGKTGLNFNGLKNEVGTFSWPDYVIIDPVFLSTLDERNWLSGFAEMIKHALISEEEEWLHKILNSYSDGDHINMLDAIYRSVKIKNDIVLSDPNESGNRKSLNFGHTIGHAFESFLSGTSNKLLHGEAVANGVICELYLSNKILGYPEERMSKWLTFIRRVYPKAQIFEKDKQELMKLMLFDKKNEKGRVNFTLIEKPGKYQIDCYLDKDVIEESLDFFIDLM